ncbi:MAG TPA: exonuclease SbcCD subunit D C-terminal domain-containing protein [Halomonas sp.]|nr:exonuclease SbcCD subunit D C-terminal domain-containing protein [Halomonas sp.]
MKLIHTADWHLGQSFHGQERFEEQRLFLDWLLTTLEERQADALLVAGDIFDVVNPSLRAQELLYDFIVRAHRRLPTLDIVLIAGNHDSGNRIELPAPLMRSLRTHALGRVAWLEDGELDAQRLLVPLTDAGGATRAWCLALPFLRPAEVTGRGLNNDDSDANDYPAGIARVHAALIRAARRQRQPDQALVAMSHAHLHGAAVSEHSERPIVIGGEESISAALFPDDIAYVALGHLHRAQQVGEPRIRYSGSPLPMDFSEVDYPHQVVEVCLDGAALVSSQALMIPRPVEMLRLGPAPLERIEQQLTDLEHDPDLPRERWPWLEVSVTLDAPLPDLRSRIESALDGKAVRLLRLKRQLPEQRTERPDARLSLDDITPRELFSRAWQQRWGEPPGDAVLADFDRLQQDVLEADVDPQTKASSPGATEQHS